MGNIRVARIVRICTRQRVRISRLYRNEHRACVCIQNRNNRETRTAEAQEHVHKEVDVDYSVDHESCFPRMRAYRKANLIRHHDRDVHHEEDLREILGEG